MKAQQNRARVGELDCLVLRRVASWDGGRQVSIDQRCGSFVSVDGVLRGSGGEALSRRCTRSEGMQATMLIGSACGVWALTGEANDWPEPVADGRLL